MWLHQTERVEFDKELTIKGIVQSCLRRKLEQIRFDSFSSTCASLFVILL